MNRARINLILDCISAGLLVAMVTTGSILKFVLPPGSGRSKVLLGLSRHEWGDLHFSLALLFVSAVAIHLVLHWRWIQCMLFKLHKGEDQTRIDKAA